MLVCVVGNYGDKKVLTDGQGIKTLELYESLKKRYGYKEVSKVNLFKKNKFILSVKLIYQLIKCDNLIILVSKNGRKTVIPFLVLLNKIFKKNIYHSLIGSTTHQTLQENPKLINCYNQLAGNWSETMTEKKLLEDCGLKNVRVIKNFKNLYPLEENELIYNSKKPFRFCTFSRVEEMKGIPNIVRTINEINHNHGEIICTLDIYGYVMDNYKSDFEILKNEFGEAIRYCGIVDFDKSVQVLKEYYMLLFPTKYYTEGIPGTILDAFSAGLPIICSEWESCYDIISSEVGVVYEFNNDNALLLAIENSIARPEVINKMKKACLNEARKYSSVEVIKEIGKILEEK